MTRWLKPGPEFAELFTTFTHLAWRLETRLAYEVDEERDAFQQYRQTGELDTGFLADWLATVRRATEAGRRFERVRVLAEPLTDYQRFEMAMAEHNRAVGEDIRTLTARRAWSLGLPELTDFWVFDDERVAKMHFTPTGRLLNVEVRDDPGTLARHMEWKALAWENAEPAPVP